jgi:uncharacterized protein with HEPN domain
VPPTLADRLAHILESILGIEQLLNGKTQADIVANRPLRLALEREFEIISEATRKIPEKTKAEEKNIDWQGIAALGNRLRHAYHRIDVDILFAITESDLPPLKAFIERVIDAEARR